MKRAAFLIFLLFCAPALATTDIETRARDIGHQLRCLVCQGESIEESNADFARDIRALVHEQIKAGKSDEEILGFMRERYGDFILMKPPLEGKNLLLWLTPFLVLGGGLIAARRFIKSP